MPLYYCLKFPVVVNVTHKNQSWILLNLPPPPVIMSIGPLQTFMWASFLFLFLSITELIHTLYQWFRKLIGVSGPEMHLQIQHNSHLELLCQESVLMWISTVLISNEQWKPWSDDGLKDSIKICLAMLNQKEEKKTGLDIVIHIYTYMVWTLNLRNCYKPANQ